MNRKLIAAVVVVMLSGPAMAVPTAASLPSAQSQAAGVAATSDATPPRGDFTAPQTYPYAERERAEMHSARPSEEELACVNWGACKPGGWHS